MFPGDDPFADFTTKHIGGQVMNTHKFRMHMVLEAGCSEKAVQLHNISNKSSWTKTREAANDQQGDGGWKSRGLNRVWRR